jgi:hypothetical protein
VKDERLFFWDTAKIGEEEAERPARSFCFFGTGGMKGEADRGKGGPTKKIGKGLT